MIEIGNKIKLKDYTKWSDHKRHKNQKATIVQKLVDSSRFDYKIKWDNGDTSNIKKENLILASLYGSVKEAIQHIVDLNT